MRMLLIFALLALLGSTSAFADDPPVVGTGPCAEFETPYGPNLCTAKYTVSLIVFGNGNVTKVVMVNPTEADIWVGVKLIPTVLKTDDWWNHLNAFGHHIVRDADGKVSWENDFNNGEGAGMLLPLKSTLEFSVIHPMVGCDQHGQNCTSQADLTAMAFGSADVWLTAAAPETLRSLQPPTVTLSVNKMDVAGNTPLVQKTPPVVVPVNE